VILIDANILIYAKNRQFSRHQAIREWLDTQLNGAAPVGLPWPSLLAFLRIVTNPRIVQQPQSIGEAWGQVLEWLACENVWLPEPTDRHSQIFGDILASCEVQANLVPDAHLAALAIGHGLILCSTDGDFARFPGLRWMNPLTQ
jgi:toxin-antitoxin system PIN domain toxin